MTTDYNGPPVTVAPGWRLMLVGLERLPQALLSRIVGRIAEIPVPPLLRRPLYGGFARMVGIDLEEVARPLSDFPTFDAFFVRRLRAGARQWPEDGSVLACPVDGVIGACGRIDEGTAIQAKGRSYRTADLLGDAQAAARYEGGLFLTVYLSPRHYHRIHAPVTGAVVRARHIPGSLLPVNEAAVAAIDRLFARNERLSCTLDGPLGSVVVVAVGATNVGRITVAFDEAWGTVRGVTNQSADRRESTRCYDEPFAVGRGDEIMAFHLGSTVVLLTEPGLELAPTTRPRREVRMGEILARKLPD